MMARALLAGAILVSALLAGRMLLGARGELAAARAAAVQNQPEAQVRHLRRAMAYYFPGNPWLRQAHDELLACGRAAESAGDRAAALVAYLELRSAILALRGLTRPYAGTLPELETRIAALWRAGGVAPLEARALRDRLARPPEPDPLWAGLGVLGFLGWSVGGLLLVGLGLRPDASLIARRFWPLLGVVLAGQLLFWLGMARA